MDQILETFQARVAPRDGASVTENPPFINVTVSPYDLHLSSTVQTLCGDGGTPVTTPIAVNDDIDGNPRSLTMPDIGADEFTSIPNPVISGPSSVCEGSAGHTYLTQAGYLGYSWLVSPGGIITAGGTSTDNMVVVTWAVPGAQSVSVNFNNSAGVPAPLPAVKNIIVNAILPASVTISASANPVCEGTPVNYTATSVNGGTLPTYHWQLNGNTAGTNNNSFSIFPANGDLVRCILTSNLACVSGNPDTSNIIAMTVNPSLPVTVSIVADQNPVPAGTEVLFTATGMNGGTGPTFQWRVNGANVGINSPQYAYIPLNGDLVTCLFTSNEICTYGNPAISNTMAVTVITGTGDPLSQRYPQMFSISPNPSDGRFFIQSKLGIPIGKLNIEIFSIHGEKVFSESAAAFNQHEIDLTLAPPGLYFVHLKSEEYTGTLKLLIRQ